MKKTLLASVALLTISQAHAQSSVTLYGIIDTGLLYTNNIGGEQSYQLASGIAQGSRWGMQGVEDLGGGNQATFRLENGFDVNTGRMLQGSRMFGRTATVGLTNTRYGAVTVGRQYDAVADFLTPYSANGQWGILLPHPGDLDNIGSDFRISNSVKYMSPRYAGLQFGGLYSFGGVAGNFQQNSAAMGGVSYVAGPISLGAAYQSIKNPFTSISDGVWTSSNTVDGNYGIAAGRYQVFGAGGAYDLGKARVSLLWTNTKFLSLDPSTGANLSGHVTFDIFEAVASYFVTPTLQLGADYIYTMGKVSATGSKPKYHNAGLVLDYFLSKRTDLYGTVTYMHAAGDAQYANLAPVLGASSTANQVAVRLGIRHKF